MVSGRLSLVNQLDFVNGANGISIEHRESVVTLREPLTGEVI